MAFKNVIPKISNCQNCNLSLNFIIIKAEINKTPDYHSSVVNQGVVSDKALQLKLNEINRIQESFLSRRTIENCYILADNSYQPGRSLRYPLPETLPYSYGVLLCWYMSELKTMGANINNFLCFRAVGRPVSLEMKVIQCKVIFIVSLIKLK